jgi:hypothetical protein
METVSESAETRKSLIPLWLRHLWSCCPYLVLAVLALLVIGVSLAIIWPITDLIATHDVGLISSAKRALALQTAREAVRAQLLTLGAGVFAAGALVYTARNFALSRGTLEETHRAVELTRQTMELTEKGQVGERYSRAIEQLGSDNLSVRIGGIYALEAIARDSPKDHPTVIEVLSAFVRLPSAVTTGGGSGSLTADVQVALTVIGRRDDTRDRLPVDLVGANLAGADLDGANLSNAKLDLSDLSHASLVGASLSGARLNGATLRDAEMRYANLTNASVSTFVPPGDADVIHADLTNANLTHATLVGAQLGHADMSGANLTSANLTNAWLFETVLSRFLMHAIFAGADLDRAHWPDNYPVPEGWMLERHGRWSGLRRVDGVEQAE